MTEKQTRNVDLVIAGGGTAGISLALALAQKTALSVAILLSFTLNINAAVAADWLIKRTNSSVEILISNCLILIIPH